MIVSLSRTSGRPDRWLVSRSKFSATFFFPLSQNCLNTWQMHIVLITMPEMSFFWANEPQAIFWGAFRSKVADPVRSWKSSEMPFAGKKCARLTSMDTSQCSFNSFNCFPFNWITINSVEFVACRVTQRSPAIATRVYLFQKHLEVSRKSSALWFAVKRISFIFGAFFRVEMDGFQEDLFFKNT